MKCPKCVAEDKKSRVTPHGGMTTLLGFSPYYDEDGDYHSHDPNSTDLGYACSNGHYWHKSIVTPCPSVKCDYGKEENDSSS